MGERPLTAEDCRQAAVAALEAGATQAAIGWALVAISTDLTELRRLERKARS